VGLYLGLAPMALYAAEPQVVRCDLRTCIDLAFAHHPQLKTSQARQEVARATINVHAAERRPRVDLEGGIGYLSGEAISPFAAIRGVTEDGVAQRTAEGGFYQFLVQGAVPLLKDGTLIGQTSSAERQAQLGLSEEEWKTRALQTQVALNVVDAYVDVLKKQVAASVHEKIVATLAASYQLAQARFAQQLLAKNDLLIAEVQFVTAKRDQSVAQLALQRSQKALALALGMDKVAAVTPQELQEPLTPLPPFERLVTATQTQHPEVKARQLRVQGSAEEVRKIRHESSPTVTLKMHYGLVDDFDGRLNDQWLTMLEVKVPLLDFGRNSSKVAVARAKMQQEEQYMAESKVDLERELHESYARVQTLEEERQLVEKQIEQATEALQLNRAKLMQNLVPPAAVAETEVALLKLQLAQSDVEHDRKLAHVRLQWISGEGAISTQ
jgi:outer membrane protein TolC